MAMWYWSVHILFDRCQLTILWMANIKDMGLSRHTWVTPPFLLIVSPTLPVQSVDAYVRTYARSVTWQPNEKRLTIFYEYGALSHARFAREGAPLWCWTFLIMDGNLDSISFSTNWQRVCYLWKLNDFKVTMPFLRYDQKQGTRES